MADVEEHPRWLSVDDTPDRLDDPDLRYVFSYWRRAAGRERAPRRRDIEPPIDLSAFLPTMVMFDVERDAAGLCTFRYRLLGTQLAEFAGRDFRGLTIAEALSDEAVARDLEIYNRVVADCVCYSGERQSMINARQAFERYGRIVMPILGDATGTVDMVWCWLRFADAARLSQ